MNKSPYKSPYAPEDMMLSSTHESESRVPRSVR